MAARDAHTGAGIEVYYRVGPGHPAHLQAQGTESLRAEA
jgi:hypothetical protein